MTCPTTPQSIAAGTTARKGGQKFAINTMNETCRCLQRALASILYKRHLKHTPCLTMKGTRFLEGNPLPATGLALLHFGRLPLENFKLFNLLVDDSVIRDYCKNIKNVLFQVNVVFMNFNCPIEVRQP